ncbi:FAD-dependent oxidoreductase [Sphingobacterium sp.]|uniref:FAD-dependent oxidoreductase n=1 Tax=Sphingobacterium sp. TaxID=341027 RepID=UPI0028AED9F1|nr:FAD-dependent oxidoreductase [Sphingobacterium sp.]
MNLRVLTFLCLLFPCLVCAQKKAKPKMFVYGSDITALSAAIQAARSNVPTVMLMDRPILAEEITSEVLQFEGNKNLDGGIWMGILMEMAISKTRDDSLAQVVKKDFNPQLARNAIDKYMRELPNLTVIKEQSISKVTRNKRNWEIILSNRQKFEVLSVVDASEDAGLVKASGLKLDSALQGGYTQAKDMGLAISRTSLAVGELDKASSVVFLKDLLDFEKENLFDIGRLRSMAKSPDNIGFRSSFGQAIGATAGYTAFFKTDSKKIDIRKLQAELLAFKARLIPYQDVEVKDPHFAAIQKCYLTGFFLGKDVEGKYIFDGDQIVKFSDVKPVLNDIYTRSQLWFLDNYREDELTWKDLLGMIKFIAFKGDEVDRQIAKDWKTKLKFEGEFSPENKVTRDQFAVVADLFSSSFAKAINLDGSFVK